MSQHVRQLAVRKKFLKILNSALFGEHWRVYSNKTMDGGFRYKLYGVRPNVYIGPLNSLLAAAGFSVQAQGNKRQGDTKPSITLRFSAGHPKTKALIATMKAGMSIRRQRTRKPAEPAKIHIVVTVNDTVFEGYILPRKEK